MCRTKLFISTKIISITLLFSFLSISCNVEKDTLLSPVHPLVKGVNYADPAVWSIGMKEFSTINVETRWQESLIKLKGSRPLKIAEYNNISHLLIHKSEFNFNSIAWTPTKKKVIMAAILKNTIEVEKNEIKNKEDIVWLWNSPKEFDEGILNIKDGKIAKYINGQFVLSQITEKQPFLEPGIYVLCIFVWDDYGHNIIASSREIPFEIYEYIIK
jgi:hypothetical protein